MKKLTTYEIEEILEQHALWLSDHTTGKKADFTACDLSAYDFSGEDLSFANFSNAVLNCCNFKNTNLFRSNLYEVTAKVCSFIKTNMAHAYAHGAIFDGSRFGATAFMKTNIFNGSFKDCFLEKVRMSQNDMGYCNFKKAVLRNCFCVGTLFGRNDFTDAYINEGSFAHASFFESKVSGATFENLSFEKTELEGVNFENVSFINVKFVDGTIHNCEF